jgi:hypothetical protein
MDKNMLKKELAALATRKTEGAEGVVVAIVLIVVAVGICILFRYSMSSILNNAMDKTGDEVDGLFKNWGADSTE